MLRVQLLGYPVVIVSDQVLPIKGKPLALLCLLAVEGRVSRRTIAQLLWDSASAQNLRQTLYVIRRQPSATGWLGDGDPLELLECVTDLERLPALDPSRRLHALERPLMDDLDGLLSDVGLEWLFVQREQLSLQRRDWMLEFARASATLQPDQARSALKALLALDPLNETATRELMRLELNDRQSDAALSAFERLRAALNKDLGSEPLPITMALAQQGRESALALSATTIRLLRAIDVVGPSDAALLAILLEREALSVAEDLAQLESDDLPDLLERIRPATPAVVTQLLHLRAGQALLDSGAPHSTAAHSTALHRAARHFLTAGELERSAAAELLAANISAPSNPLQAAQHYQRCVWLSQQFGTRLAALIGWRQVSEATGDLATLRALADVFEQLATDWQRDEAVFECAHLRAIVALRSGQPKIAFEHTEDALLAAKRLRDSTRLEGARLTCGAVRLALGDLAAAAQIFDALTRSQTAQVRATALGNLGAIAGMRGDFSQSFELLEDCLALARQLTNLTFTARVLANLATTASKLERYERAGRGWREAIALADRSGDELTRGVCYANLSLTLLASGSLGQAFNTALEVIHAAQTAPTARYVASGVLYSVYAWLGQWKLAQAQHEETMALASQFENQRQIAAARVNAWLLVLRSSSSREASRLERDLSLFEQPALAHDDGLLLKRELMLIAQRTDTFRAVSLTPNGRPHHDLIHTTAQARLALLTKAPFDPSLLSAALEENTYLETPSVYLILAALLKRDHLPAQGAIQRAQAVFERQLEGLPKPLRAAAKIWRPPTRLD